MVAAQNQTVHTVNFTLNLMGDSLAPESKESSCNYIKKFAILDADQVIRFGSDISPDFILDKIFSPTPHALDEFVLFKAQGLDPKKQHAFRFEVSLRGKDLPLPDVGLFMIYSTSKPKQNVTSVFILNGEKSIQNALKELQIATLENLKGSQIEVDLDGDRVVFF